MNPCASIIPCVGRHLSVGVGMQNFVAELSFVIAGGWVGRTFIFVLIAQGPLSHNFFGPSLEMPASRPASAVKNSYLGWNCVFGESNYGGG